MLISTMRELEEAAMKYGILPFFRNNVRGFSVEEMTAPGMLFGGNEFDGCWEWKGPVVRNRTTAYGKFFRRKAGFISLEFLPYFLKFRRDRYHVAEDSTDEMIYDIITINGNMTSTELREMITGKPRKRKAFDLPEVEYVAPLDLKQPSRHSFEGPLQRLQMAGRLCISDFKYKTTKTGERYGWGVAEYSTPEAVFENETLTVELSPRECLDFLVEQICLRYPKATPSGLRTLLS